MAKLPYMQFYPADYLRDTRCLSLASRGVWMDVLCALWHAPKRGQKTLSLEGWAGEIGQPKSEVSMWLLDLELNGIGKFIHEVDGKLTIISRRMVRDERNRKQASKRKQDQRDRVESRMSHIACPPHVTGIYQNQKSESESEVRSHIQNQKSESDKKKKKIPCAMPSASATAWRRYAEAYTARYKTDPVRNAKVNGQFAQLVKRIGEKAAPEVAAFYVWHNDQFYVRSRHPPGLLLRDCEGLHTQWKTGETVTHSQAIQVDKTQGRLNVFQKLINERKHGEVIDVEPA